MGIRTRVAPGILAAGLLLGLAHTPAAFAQDSMQLDTMFRESLSHGRDPQGRREEERRQVEGRRYQEGRNVRRREEERRHVQGRPEEGR